MLQAVFFTSSIQAQSPAFLHLGTAEGLSDNNVNTARRDRNGILWIGTSEGLNSFDGNSVTSYYKYQHPQLTDNNIRSIEIGGDNYIWLRTGGHHLTVLDEKRRFQSLLIGDENDNTVVTNLVGTEKFGVLALKGRAHFQLLKSPVRSERIQFAFEPWLPKAISFYFKPDGNKVVYYGEERLVAVDYASQKVLLNLQIKGLAGGAAINEDEMLVYPTDGKAFYRISIASGKIVETYTGFRDQHGKPIAGNLRQMARINDHNFAITTRFSGVYLLDLNKQSFDHWYHDPLDSKSIGGNNSFRIHYDSSGYLFVTTQTSGLHFFNVNRRTAFTKSYFRDIKGEVFDGYIEAITERPDGMVFLGAQDRLIRWNRKNDISEFIDCRLPNGQSILGEETIRAVDFDDKGRLWVGTTRHGLLVLDKNFKTIRQISDNNGKSAALPANWINSISTDAKGQKWIATLRGICMIDQETFSVRDATGFPGLDKLKGKHVTTLWFDKAKRMWVGTTAGAFCYDFTTGELRQYTTRDGLPANTILCFNEDKNGQTYMGTPAGLAVLQQEKITVYNRSNGLRNDKCEDILRDENGILWIGNLNCILRFDPEKKMFTVFEEGHGLTQAGIRMRSSFRNPEGEMFWGSDKGLVVFHPAQMSSSPVPIIPVVTSVFVRDSMYHFSSTEEIRLPYNSSEISIRFSSGELSGQKKTQFLYKLSGYDEEWKTPLLSGQVIYSQLPPGEYRFDIKASADGINWADGRFPVYLAVSNPWWKQAWFNITVLIFLAGVGWVAYRMVQARKTASATQKMIEYFALSGYEDSSVESILWDIARNCISRLNFEDCVIYLLEDDRNVLVQKAAYGPKSPRGFEIANPIEIPLGKGIVGAVAESGKAAMISDTSKDSRYIVDDERRYSEMTVPIIHEGKVIGVIDSENRKKSFYTQQQLKAVQTIASLSSAKISRAMALDAMKKSRAELMELNVKMAESKFLNLRLQMNPHFLFNSLSSIQHLIVSQQTTKAYKYLTVFSNFLRSLLRYAEENFIPLDQEVNILRMYIELESLRFDQSFQYEISIDEGLTNEQVLVPSLMVQPFAENAIWHGLLHKEGCKTLQITFQNQSEDFLSCTIKDNGIGRAKAAEINRSKISSNLHESKGISIIRERLFLLEKKTGKPAKLKIEDLLDEAGEPAGTEVQIIIPFYNPEES